MELPENVVFIVGSGGCPDYLCFNCAVRAALGPDAPMIRVRLTTHDTHKCDECQHYIT